MTTLQPPAFSLLLSLRGDSWMWPPGQAELEKEACACITALPLSPADLRRPHHFLPMSSAL